MGTMMPERALRIRRVAGRADAAACARMMVATEPWLTLGRTYDQAQATLRDPAHEVYVCDDDSGIRGFIVLVLAGAFTGYIKAVCVAPDARGRGIGTRLVRFAEERIATLSPAIFLTVSSFNPRAQALYERLGFRVVGELPDYIVDGHSEILMRKQSVPWNRFVPRAPTA
jgi:[ribosomal protein S18]-alanine N-acetyltransferase